MSKTPLINIPKGYCSQAEDTSKEIDWLQFQRWQQLDLVTKATLITNATQGCRQLSLIGIKNQYPHATNQEQRYWYVKRILGERWADLINNWPINQKVMIGNPIELALLITEILTSLEIPYFIGGSVASSLWGESRATLDLDLVVDLHLGQIEKFVNQVNQIFYISQTAIEEAILHQSCFNLIHFETNEKIDIFILKNTPLAATEMRRKRLQQVTEEGGFLYLASPEDIIIEKLIWYRQGNRISDRQWRDILGVLKTQAKQLDFTYLNYWIESENLTDLFTQALTQSGLS
jgi:hypothetical protein